MPFLRNPHGQPGYGLVDGTAEGDLPVSPNLGEVVRETCQLAGQVALVGFGVNLLCDDWEWMKFANHVSIVGCGHYARTLEPIKSLQLDLHLTDEAALKQHLNKHSFLHDTVTRMFDRNCRTHRRTQRFRRQSFLLHRCKCTFHPCLTWCSPIQVEILWRNNAVS